VTVLSHGFWQRRFGGDPKVLGRDILLDGRPYTIVGVMPRRFQFFERYVALWVPAAMTAEELANRGAHYLTVVARLKPGVAVAGAQADLEAVAGRIATAFPDHGFHPFALPLREQLVGGARRPLLVLVLATVSVLLVTCANLAGLLLARARSRGREIAVRTALGATGSRIVRQLLTESVTLAALGAVPALAVASWSLSALQQLVPEGVALSIDPALDIRALAGAAALSVLAGLLFGLTPALQAVRRDLNEGLRQGARGATAGDPHRLRNALVVSQVAATLVLLVGAGLLGKTLYRLRYADLGLQPKKVLTLRTRLADPRYDDQARRTAFYEGVLARVAAIPGVVSAGYSTSVPLEWKGGTNGFEPEGFYDRRRTYDAVHRQVSADYLRTMGIPLRRGRFFERTDGPESPRVVIVNEAMAREYWPGLDPLGRRLLLGRPSGKQWATIVGIVGDVRQMGLDAPAKPEMYFPHAQIQDQPWFAPRDLVVRTAGDPMALVPPVKQAIHSVDPDQPVSNIRTFDEVLDEEVAPRRVGAAVVAAFAAVALLLASLGVYGVLSNFVADQTAEIGVRLALGAGRRDILRLVLGQGLTLALAGVGLGGLSALALTRLVSSLLYGVEPADPATFLGATLLLSALALLACYFPARRALAIDAMSAMRCE
jgi:predicted permease